MNILWYNTWSLPIITSNNHINNVTDYILNNVIKYNIDIIALCEVFDLSTRNKYIYLILKALSGWGIVDKGTEKKLNFQFSSGLLIFYRKENVDILNSKNHILNNSAMIDMICAKAIIGIYIYDKINDDKKWLIFTHLQNADAGYKNYCLINTKKQFNELVKKINEWSIDKCNILCIGDFNLEPKKLSKSFLLKNDLICLHTKNATCSNQILDYLICSVNLKNNIRLSLADNFKNPSDHKLLIVETEQIKKDKRKIVKLPYKKLPYNRKYFFKFLSLFNIFFSKFSSLL